MRRLSDELGETVQLARLDGTDIIYLAQLPGHYPVRLVSSLGSRLPAHATALGKALLAHREQRDLDTQLHFPLAAFTERTLTDRTRLYENLQLVRTQGVAEDIEEVSRGLFCFAIAVPSSGLPTDALSVSVPSVRMTPDNHRRIVQLLLAEAARLEEELSPVHAAILESTGAK